MNMELYTFRFCVIILLTENAIEHNCIPLNTLSKEINNRFQMPECKFDWFSYCFPFTDDDH